MKLCRFQHGRQPRVGLYSDDQVVPLVAAAAAMGGEALPASDNLLEFLPPDGASHQQASRVVEWSRGAGADACRKLAIPTADVELLVPIPRPNKLFLLAGNYAEHIREGGGAAAERRETFPYVFMKPPTTTLTNPGAAVTIPAVSPGAIDWELELAVVIGRKCKSVREADALGYVAGYTIVNDISNRSFRPNPHRTAREKDKFFDWLHGKWFDSFCPCGPCVASPDEIGDPQRLAMKLSLNGQARQDSSTSAQIFPVAAVIEFISDMVTLEPGDIISTGTPAGVGNTTGTYLKPGDRLDAWIEKIGTLVSPVAAEKA